MAHDARAVGLFERAGRIPYSPYLLVLVPVVVSCVQVAMESLLIGRPASLRGVLHTCMDYLVVQVLIVAALSLASGRGFRDLAGVVSLGLVLGWAPRALHAVWRDDATRWFAHFETFRWSFAAPYQIRWETLMVWVAILLSGGFVLWLTRSFWRSALAIVGVYVAFQIMSWGLTAGAAAIVQRARLVHMDVHGLLAITVFLGTYLAFSHAAVLRSVYRFNRALPWALVAAIGARMAGQDWPRVAAKAYVVGLAVVLVALADDYFDGLREPGSTRRIRPVSADDFVIVVFCQVLVVAWGGLLEPAGAFLLILFFGLGFLYDLPGLRLKQLFCASYTIEGASAAAAFLYGTCGSSGFPQARWVAIFALLVLGGFALGSMFKDYKDIDADRAERRGTVYTRYLARGRSLTAIHTVVSITTSAALLAAPIWLLSRSQGAGPALVLCAIAPLPAIALLAFRDRERAVEIAIWCMSAYFGVLLSAAPRLG